MFLIFLYLFFLKWLNFAWKRLLVNKYFFDYISLCEDKEWLFYELWKLWYIFIVYDLLYFFNIELSKKYTNEDFDTIFPNIEEFIKEKKLLEKITFYSDLDFYHIAISLFENPDYVFHKIIDLFELSEEEKTEFNKLKRTHFDILYKNNLIKLRETLTKIWYSIIFETEFEQVNDIKEYNFYNSLKKSLTNLSITNDYILIFISVTNKVSTFYIWNTDKKIWYWYNLLQWELFYKDAIDFYKRYKNDLIRNDMNFSVILLKWNWWRETNPINIKEFVA